MKIVTFCFLLLFITPIYAQRAAVVLAEESCRCIEKTAKISVEDIEQLTNSCIEEAIDIHLELLQKEYASEQTETEAEELGEKIGLEIGEILIKECQAMKDLLIGEEEVVPPVEMEEEQNTALALEGAQQTEGILIDLRGGELAYLIITDDYGDQVSFLWLTPFEGDHYFNYGINGHKGHLIRVYWKPIELYNPIAKRYRKAKGILGVEMLD